MTSLHYIEITTRYFDNRVRQFQLQFGFTVYAHKIGVCKTTSDRKSEQLSVALKLNSILFLITKVEYEDHLDGLPSEDWISDVAFCVPDTVFTSLLQTLSSDIGHSSKHTIVIKTLFPFLHHTFTRDICMCHLVDDDCTNVPCLPGYQYCSSLFHKKCEFCVCTEHISSPLLTHIDHVTFVCLPNTSKEIIHW